jgi:competence protein ComFC
MCGRELGECSIRDILFGDDPLCLTCRKQWKYDPQCFCVDGIQADSDYLYREGFSASLIQYKECGDEALKEVFLQPVIRKLRRRYRGMTLCLMPSSEEKKKERGFSHLMEMYASLGLPMMEPFIKNESTVQKKLTYVGRQMIMDQISLRNGMVLPEKIVLCDDVITTGATFKGALHCIDRTKHQILIYAAAADNDGKKQKKRGEWE